MTAGLFEGPSGVLTTSLDVASVDANTTAEQTFTVEGLKVGDFVSVNKPSHSTGLGIVGCRVSAVDTLAITFANVTASPINPAAEAYLVHWRRYERRGDSRANV